MTKGFANRPYKTESELGQLIGKCFKTTESKLLQHNGKKILSIRELDETEYDRNIENGFGGWLIDTMYEAILDDKTRIPIFEDEII